MAEGEEGFSISMGCSGSWHDVMAAGSWGSCSHYICKREAESGPGMGPGYKTLKAHSSGTQLPPIRLNLLRVPQPSKRVPPARVLLIRQDTHSGEGSLWDLKPLALPEGQWEKHNTRVSTVQAGRNRHEKTVGSVLHSVTFEVRPALWSFTLTWSPGSKLFVAIINL